MKKLPLFALIGIIALFSGCACDCADYSPNITVQFEGFDAKELETIYVVNTTSQTTCTTCLQFSGNTARLEIGPNVELQLKSDSIPLNKVIKVKDVRSETTKEFSCECLGFTGVDYEVDGKNYTNEPVTITK